MGRPGKNEVGNRHGRWTVIKRISPVGAFKGLRWECVCDCGKAGEVNGCHLRNGTSKSCGCLAGELQSKRMKRHGMCETKLYKVWQGMIQRCSPGGRGLYKERYWGRGITVHPSWKGEGGFLRWKEYMGPMPTPRHTNERINNDGNYEPGNVKWATYKEQNNNRAKRLRIEQYTTEELYAELFKRAGI